MGSVLLTNSLLYYYIDLSTVFFLRIQYFVKRLSLYNLLKKVMFQIRLKMCVQYYVLQYIIYLHSF